MAASGKNGRRGSSGTKKSRPQPGRTPARDKQPSRAGSSRPTSSRENNTPAQKQLAKYFGRPWFSILAGIALGLVLGGLIVLLFWPSMETARPPEQETKATKSEVETAARPKAARPDRGAPSTLAFEEPGPTLQRRVALADAAIMAALNQLGLDEKAIRFSRVRNVVEADHYYERAEIGLDLGKLQPGIVEEALLETLSRLDFPVTLTGGEEADGQNFLEVRLQGHLTHLLHLASLPPVKKAGKGRGRIAIIIDDLGYHPKGDLAFLDLDLDLTMAILPFSPDGAQLAQTAKERGREVLLHLPMEPQGYPETDPGPGALLTSMNEELIAETLAENLADLPQATGVNNHMGSSFTEDADRMRVVMQELKKRQLFFVDSRTTPLSQCLEAAGEMGVKTARRSVFLDNVADPAAIRAQIARLIARANEDGQAIGIAHPYPETRAVLNEMAGEISDQVEIVPASKLVN